MINDYVYATEKIVFRHKVSENLPCNSYSTHTHNAYELIYFVEGDATHVIEDRKYKLKPGDLIIIRPFQYHFIQIDSMCRYDRYDILFDRERDGIESVSYIPDGVEVINLADNRIAEDIFHRCELYREKYGEETFGKIIPHLLSELFYSIGLFSYTESITAQSLSSLISKALEYINDNLCTLTGISEVASHLFVSESYLFRLFKAELHRTPKKYIMEKRLLLAQMRIQAGERPTEVAESCGFSDYTTFYRNYVAHFGCVPSKK